MWIYRMSATNNELYPRHIRPAFCNPHLTLHNQSGRDSEDIIAFLISQILMRVYGQYAICSTQNKLMTGSITLPFLPIGIFFFSWNNFFLYMLLTTTPIIMITDKNKSSKTLKTIFVPFIVMKCSKQMQKSPMVIVSLYLNVLFKCFA